MESKKSDKGNYITKKYTTTGYGKLLGVGRQIVWIWCKNNKIPDKYQQDAKIERVGIGYIIKVKVKK